MLYLIPHMFLVASFSLLFPKRESLAWRSILRAVNSIEEEVRTAGDIRLWYKCARSKCGISLSHTDSCFWSCCHSIRPSVRTSRLKCPAASSWMCYQSFSFSRSKDIRRMPTSSHLALEQRDEMRAEQPRISKERGCCDFARTGQEILFYCYSKSLYYLSNIIRIMVLVNRFTRLLVDLPLYYDGRIPVCKSQL